MCTSVCFKEKLVGTKASRWCILANSSFLAHPSLVIKASSGVLPTKLPSSGEQQALQNFKFQPKAMNMDAGMDFVCMINRKFTIFALPSTGPSPYPPPRPSQPLALRFSKQDSDTSPCILLTPGDVHQSPKMPPLSLGELKAISLSGSILAGCLHLRRNPSSLSHRGEVEGGLLKESQFP